jgi:membrane-associated protease RseP (regulator of RpoE activity)
MIGESSPSGHTQITITNTTADTVNAALKARLDELARLSTIVRGRGTGTNTPPAQQSTPLFIKVTAVGKDVLIVVEISGISPPNPGEPYLSGSFNPATQTVLDVLKAVKRDVNPTGAEKSYRESNAWFGAFTASHSQAERLGRSCPKPREHMGICIVGVSSNSPAFLAGLRMKDVLISFNGMPVRSGDEYTAALASTRIGQSVPVVYARDGQVKTLKTALAPWPKDVPKF